MRFDLKSILRLGCAVAAGLSVWTAIFGENAGLADNVVRIESARVYEVARVTALDRMRRLSDRLGANAYLKREDTQEVHSFKIRGAYNKMCRLSAEERARGVLAASAGNHAQGVALSAKVLGTTATIVMPETTPKIKVDEVASYGAGIVLRGETYSDAAAEAKRLLKILDAAFTPTEPCARLIGILRDAVGAGEISAARSREIVQAIDDSLNLRVTTAEDRRQLMG